MTTLARLALAAGALSALAGPLPAADWKPADAPLMTRWGKQVTPENAWQQYPRPQLVRQDWANLNGLWDYAVTDKAASKPEKWDGKILVPFCIESALSGVGKRVTPQQELWYRRSFEVPAGWKGRRVLLHFQAVDWESTASVNGKELGTHKGGFDPFAYDITDALKDGANELVVRVWDPTDQGTQPRGKQVSKPGGIWYTPVTGIWQTVWLEPVADAYVTKVSATADVDKGEVEFRIDCAGAKDGDVVQVTVGAATVATPEARPAGGKSETVYVSHAVAPPPPPVTVRAKPNVPFRLRVPGRQPWSPDSPVLHHLDVALLRGAGAVDAVQSYFAMRKVSAGKDPAGVPRIMLNNRPQFLIGPLDQGWWPDGLLTPPSDEAMVYDLKVLKDLGMNMLRKHIKVEPERLYYHCDVLGLVVWQDMPSGGMPSKGQFIRPDAKEDAKFAEEDKKQFLAELGAMIDHLRFYPCIAVWVPFNEGWGQHDTNAILKWVKDRDPTRLVDAPSGWTDRGFGDLKDMHNYPGPGMYPVLPDRVSVLGEFGGLGLPVKGHLWKDQGNWGYRTYKTTEELRDHYRRLMLRLHPLVGKGLSAAVYTQTTDVEVEVNGLMTYDREVIKLDVPEAAKWHKALFGPPPALKVLADTSQQQGQTWRYTLEKPADGWQKPDFDAAKWAEGTGGFGTAGTPGAVVRTEWKTADIWLRRTFELKEPPKGEVLLLLHHDEDADVYVNGVLAAREPGYVTDYGLVPITDEARKALKTGANVIAIHCKQTGGGQYIDAGLVELVGPAAGR
jgi:hypothetical protein